MPKTSKETASPSPEVAATAAERTPVAARHRQRRVGMQWQGRGRQRQSFHKPMEVSVLGNCGHVVAVATLDMTSILSEQERVSAKFTVQSSSLFSSSEQVK